MDLNKELLESGNGRRQTGGWKASATSLVLHGLLIAGVVYAGTQTTHKVANEKAIQAFITQGAAPPPPPPPPPPPAAKSSGSPKKATPKVEQPKPVQITPMTPPVEIPKEVPKVEPIPSTKTLPDVPETAAVDDSSMASSGTDEGPGDAVNGVVGGVEGGVAGGVVGGEVGGVIGGELGGVKGGELGGKVGGVLGGTGTGNEGTGTGGVEAPVAPPAPPPPPPAGPLRVGGDVKAPIIIDRAEPKYTEAARAARISGLVVVEATIDRNGRVTDVKVVKGLPMGLSAEAEAAVRRWRFKPGTQNGQPVPVYFNLTVTFKID